MTDHTTAFFQERILNGVLSHRISPRAPWVAYTAEELSNRIETIQAEAQREVSASIKEVTQEYDKKIKAMKVTLATDERKRITDIIETEDELSDELPSDKRQLLEQMDRVTLCRVVVKATKKAIKEKVLGL